MSGREEPKEEDELILSCNNISSSSRDHNHHDHDDHDGIQQKHKEKEKKGIARAKSLFLLPFKKFDKLQSSISSSNKENKKKKKKNRRPPSPPFPYSEDLGGRGCYLCFMQPPIPPAASSSPLRPSPLGEPKTTQQPSSSYYDFLKSLVEKNDFYSPECNVHRDVRSQESSRA